MYYWLHQRLLIPFLLLLFLLSVIRFVRKDRRFVILRFGRVVAQRGPGFVFLLPFEKTIEVDLREQILLLDRRTYSTGDGKQVRIFGSMRWQITDPIRSVTLLETTFGIIQVFVEKWLDVAVTTFSAADVDEHSKDLQNKLLASLQKELPAWGSDLLACEIVGIRQDREETG